MVEGNIDEELVPASLYLTVSDSSEHTYEVTTSVPARLAADLDKGLSGELVAWLNQHEDDWSPQADHPDMAVISERGLMGIEVLRVGPRDSDGQQAAVSEPSSPAAGLEQLTDDELSHLHAEAARILSARSDARLSAAIREASDGADPDGSPAVSVTFGVREEAGGLVWDEHYGSAALADGRTTPVDLSEHHDTVRLLASYAARQESMTEDSTLTVAFDPPAITVAQFQD